MSKFSPGVVKDDEMLSLFIFFPIQFTRKGVVKPSVFDHIHSQGRSIQRDTVANLLELKNFVQAFLSGGDDRRWIGVITTECLNVRNITIDPEVARAICVFDTAEPDNPAHAELCRARVMDEADKVELRSELWKAFNADSVTRPNEYRNGQVWTSLSDELRSRPTVKRN